MSTTAASKSVIKAFEPREARPARGSPRGEPVDRPWSTRALADSAWLSSRPTRCAFHPTPLPEYIFHRHHARSAAAASEQRHRSFRVPWRVARARFAPWRTGQPPAEHARAGGLGMVFFEANPGRAAPHAVGRGSSAPKPRQVGGCGFETKSPKLPNPAARGPRALHPVENRPTAHGARARWRTWRGCLRGQRGASSTPRRWTRLFRTATAPCRRLRLQNNASEASESRGSRPTRALRLVENRPTAHGARTRWRTWRGCLRGQRVARCTPRRLPRLFRTDTAPCRRLRLRNNVVGVFKSRGALPARASPRGELADRPRSTRALADLAWLSSRPPQGALHPTPSAEALPHRHHAMSAAVTS